MRIFKPLLHRLLMLPLLRRAFRDINSAQLAIARLGRGMLPGLSLVTLAVLWDRAAHPGPLLWSQRRDRVRATVGARTKMIGTLLLAALMLLEARLVLGSRTFTMNRTSANGRDFRGRLVDWQSGLNLFSTPADWVSESAWDTCRRPAP